MSKQVCVGATLMCTMGSAPAQLAVLPVRTVRVENKLAATIFDHAPTVNIPTFGLCKSPANPQVAAATVAAMGVLTPQPCLPATAAPWAPGSPMIQIDGQVALNNTSKCLCTWFGVISITTPGQTSVDLP